MNLMLLMEGQQQIVLSCLKELPDKVIQLEHIYTCSRNHIFIYHAKLKY